MGATDTRNMWSNFAVNKRLHTVASRWILIIYPHHVIYPVLLFSLNIPPKKNKSSSQ